VLPQSVARMTLMRSGSRAIFDFRFWIFDFGLA
jgi:hypothetical protein